MQDNLYQNSKLLSEAPTSKDKLNNCIMHILASLKLTRAGMESKQYFISKTMHEKI